MRSESDIKRDVEAEIRWTPEIDDTDIAVKVNGSEVTLTGYARNFWEKCKAESVVRTVKGVAAVANDIVVKLPSGGPTDPEIARAAVSALQTDLPYSAEKIRALVHEGHVSLEGTVEWHFQREKAENAVRRLPGVISIRNSIRIKPSLAAQNIKLRIEDAFRRIAEVDADHIVVDTSGSEVTLRGEVRSWAERDQAQRTAWSAPGVTNVKNELAVRS